MKQDTFELKDLYSGKIKSADYQRVPTAAEMEKFTPWNELKCDPLKISFRDGRYWVFDGQHRLTALKNLNGGKDLMVKCLVYYGLTHDDEAWLFAHQDEGKSKVYTNQKLRSSFLGHEEKVVQFKKLIEKVGFNIDFTSSPAPNKISACAKAYGIFEKTTCAEFSLILRVIRNAWDGQPKSLKPEILGGMYELFKAHAGEININTLTERLSQADPKDIIRDGKSAVHGADKRFANQMIYIYNKRLKSRKLYELSLH